MSRLQTLRMIFATVAAVALVVSVAPGAGAHHRPNVYCSESGDMCQSTGKVNNVRRLQIRTLYDYFLTYRVCVKPPYADATCKRFRMHETENASWASSIRWRRHFPMMGAGAYTVTWRANGSRIGRRLGFHVR